MRARITFERCILIATRQHLKISHYTYKDTMWSQGMDPIL